MWKIGDEVTFHSPNEEFDHVTNISGYVNDIVYYKIIDFMDNNNIIIVQGKAEGRKIPVNVDEYMINTKETLTEHLLSLNNVKLAICNKIKQLYRKHNNEHGSAFQFKGV